jgi:CRP-like cAMP-binding protein
MPTVWPGLRESGQTRCYGPGETVMPAGRPDCVQVIEDGLVRVTAHEGRGEDAFLRTRGPGQVLGDELLLPRAERQGGRGVAAVALTGCTTLAVSREAFLACLRDRPHLWEGLARDLIRRVAEDEERIMRLARDPVDVRLAWLLVHLTRLGGAVEEDGSLGLPVNLSREDLALWICAARRSVGAALQDWRSRGVTASRHGKLVIRDLGFLITKADIPRDRRAADGVGVAVKPGPAPNRHGAAVERPTAATRARPP